MAIKSDRVVDVFLLKLDATMSMEGVLLAVLHSSMFLLLKAAKSTDASNTSWEDVKNVITDILCSTIVVNFPTALFQRNANA